MLQTREHTYLTLESLGRSRTGVCVEDLYGDLARVLAIFREKDSRHSSATDFAADYIAVADCVLKRSEIENLEVVRSFLA